MKNTAIIFIEHPSADAAGHAQRHEINNCISTGSPGRLACALLVTLLLACSLWLALPAWAKENSQPPAKPSKDQRCPVCGMFVYKYPDWVAAVSHTDGETVYFDGAKDMLRYLKDPLASAGIKELPRTASAWVTEYYGLTMIDAHKALYVMGSKVYGPMGHELIPFATREEAEEFMRDHRGKRILTFQEITPSILKALR